jgi:alanyl-tRNA synthetase
MGRGEAEELGAMALFGEKYGEWVRVVEVDGVSRELCGGTHVANTAEVGIFKIVSEGSSAANVRRIEALTGPAAIDWFRERENRLNEVGELLGAPQDPLGGARRAAERLEAAGAGAEQAMRDELTVEAARMADAAGDLALRDSDGKVVAVIDVKAGDFDPKQLRELANMVQSKAGMPPAVVLGGASGSKAGLVVLISKDAVAAGLSAASVVDRAAPLIDGGGGGREDMAQAGGKNPEGLEDALRAARESIEREVAG